jgi:hypothetical protein
MYRTQGGDRRAEAKRNINALCTNQTPTFQLYIVENATSLNLENQLTALLLSVQPASFQRHIASF